MVQVPIIGGRGGNVKGPRPAFDAFKTVAAHLAGFTSARLERQGGVTAVTFERGDRTTTVLWSEAAHRRCGPARPGLLVDERAGRRR
ncbi:MAG: hypothetical protein HZY76_11970 [Anaerolineae bacterium]|nr:MAG: hypothetical protein HZY76_11970 [Anaerolineae bacterium]